MPLQAAAVAAVLKPSLQHTHTHVFSPTLTCNVAAEGGSEASGTTTRSAVSLPDLRLQPIPTILQRGEERGEGRSSSWVSAPSATYDAPLK